MFDGNIAITGGQFTQAETIIHNANDNQSNAFKLLQEHVATSAFHNSAQRVDPPRCHPNTRVAILQNIYEWILQSQEREKWLLWLNGAAGAGKSAIIQSIAERCAQAAIAIASFFFFRADSTRNTIAPLIATLVYQLVQVIPETLDGILLTIERNPLIFDQSLVSQLQQLLIQPLLRLPNQLRQVFVMFIDGLDECNDRAHQSELIKVLGSVSRDRTIPVVFIVSSRREPQIEAAFADRHIYGLLRKFPLDNSDIEQTWDDIRRFLVEKMKAMKETHIRRHLLPADWPPMAAVEEITSKSSGQFIYASVIVNYLSSPRANPARQLEIVRGIRMRDPSSQNPFAHLDALYQHIFSQVEDPEKVIDILAYDLITASDTYISTLEDIFLLDAGELEVYFADLTSVIECKMRIIFLHASLPDFLWDKSRSEGYHIDIEKYQVKLLCMLLDRIPQMTGPLSAPGALERQEYIRIYAISQLLRREVKASDKLQRSFMNFNFTFYKINGNISPLRSATYILKKLKQFDFGDRHQTYYHVLEVFSVALAKNWDLVGREDKDLVESSPDLNTRICRILKGKGKGWFHSLKKLLLPQSKAIDYVHTKF